MSIIQTVCLKLLSRESRVAVTRETFLSANEEVERAIVTTFNSYLNIDAEVALSLVHNAVSDEVSGPVGANTLSSDKKAREYLQGHFQQLTKPACSALIALGRLLK